MKQILKFLEQDYLCILIFLKYTGFYLYSSQPKFDNPWHSSLIWAFQILSLFVKFLDFCWSTDGWSSSSRGWHLKQIIQWVQRLHNCNLPTRPFEWKVGWHLQGMASFLIILDTTTTKISFWFTVYFLVGLWNDRSHRPETWRNH